MSTVPPIAKPAKAPLCVTCAHWRCYDVDRKGAALTGSTEDGDIRAVPATLRIDGFLRSDEGKMGGTVMGRCHLEPVTVEAFSTHGCSRHSDLTDFEAFWLREISELLRQRMT